MKVAGQETPSCSFNLPSPAHEFCCAQPHLSWADKIRLQCAAGCPAVETSQAGISESKNTVITKASISYFHRCLKPDDTSATISSCAPHCQQQ